MGLCLSCEDDEFSHGCDSDPFTHRYEHGSEVFVPRKPEPYIPYNTTFTPSRIPAYNPEWNPQTY